MPLSKQALLVENNTNFPNNNAGYITPELLRQFNTDMIDAMQLTQSMSEYAELAGGNTFTGNQTIVGNLNVSGVISASVLYVQTETASVIYSSGSNQLGDELTDIQTLSGSVKVQGSLTVNGVAVLTGSVSVDTGSLVTTASFNAYTSSTNLRLNSLETNSASVNVSISNLNTTTASLSTSITNINQFTQSQAALNGTFATTGSNTFTGNQIIDRASKLYTNGIYWTDPTAGFNNLEIINQGGGNLDFASLNGGKVRIVNTPLVLTGSALTSSNDISTSANIYAANLTGSATIPAGTISSSAQITSLGFVSSSVTASSLITASFSGNTLTFTKGDASTFGVVIPDVSGSTIDTGSFVTTSSFNAYTSSNDQKVNSLISATGSYVTSAITASSLVTASVNLNTITFTKGDGTTFPITVNTGSGGGGTIDTGSFATTGSNTFIGTQIISGAMFVYDSGSGAQAEIMNGQISRFPQLYANTLVPGQILDDNGVNILIKTNAGGATNGGFLVVNTVSGSQFTGSVAVQGDVNITGQYLINGVPISGSGGSINTGSFATTGSNTFYGSQTISGSVLPLSNFGGSLGASGQNWTNLYVNEIQGLSNLRLDTIKFNGVTLPLASIQPRQFFGNGIDASTAMYYGTSSSDVNALRELAYVPSGSPTTPDMNILSASFASTIGGIVTGTGFATTGSNTFFGNQTLVSSSLSLQGSGNFSMPNGFGITGNSGQITNLSAANTIQFITEGAAGPGGTNDIKFINRVSGSKIIFENTQGGQGNGIEFTAGYVSFNIAALSGSTGKVSFGSNTTSIEALFTPISASAFKAGAGGINSAGALTASLQQGYTWVGNASGVSTLVATSSFTGSGGGGTTYINPTLNPYSGSLILVANTFTSSSFGHISASANGQVNLVFKNNNNTGDTILSGSNNIFTNPSTPAGGYIRYIGGANNLYLNNVNGVNSQITSSAASVSGVRPVMNNNIFNGTGNFQINQANNPGTHTYSHNTISGVGNTVINALAFTGSLNILSNVLNGGGLTANPASASIAEIASGLSGSGTVTMNNNIVNGGSITSTTSRTLGTAQNQITQANVVAGTSVTVTNISSSFAVAASQNITNNTMLYTNALASAIHTSAGIMSQNQGAVSINAIGSALSYSNNVSLGSPSITNQSFSGSAGGGQMSLNRTLFQGQQHQIITTGSTDAGAGVINMSDNTILGRSNTIFINSTGAGVYNSFNGNVVGGQNLNITGSNSFSLNQGGGAYFGRWNADDGIRNRTNQNIFVVGTGNATTRKTGFLIDSGSNTFIEGTLNVSGSSTFTGSLNGLLLTKGPGNNNTGLGVNVLQNAVSGGNVAIGNNALQSNTSGTDNIAIGDSALQANISGDRNMAIGSYTLDSNTTGTLNVGVGNAVLTGLIDGSANVGIGFEALKNQTTSDNNVGIGKQTLNQNISGSGNIAIGAEAGYYETGSNNFYVNNTKYGSINADRSGSLMWGKMDTTTANQTLQINARTRFTNEVLFTTGSNQQAGTATLDGGNPGAVTVSNSLVTANSIIMLTKQTLTNAHMVAITAKSGGSFTITSNGNGDADTVGWFIINNS